MKYKINKLIEVIYLHYLLVMLLFMRYVGHYKIWNIFCLFGLIVCLAVSRKCRRHFFKNTNIILFCLLIISMILISCLWFGKQNYTFENMALLLWCLVGTCAFSCVSQEMDCVDHFFKTIFWKLNFVWIINLITLIIQVSGIPFLIKKEWLARNPFYEDLCCGLFGFNGTHIICMFATLMFLYNIAYSNIVEKRNKKKIIVYTITTLIIFSICSAKSDNGFFYFFIIITYLVSILMKSKISINKKAFKFLRYIFLGILIFAILLSISSIREYVMYKLQKNIMSFRTVAYTEVNYRFYHTLYAIKEKNGLWFGQGIGFNTWEDSILYGRRSFGNNSLSELTCSFGFLSFIIYTLMYTLCCFDFMHMKRNTIKMLILWVYVIIVAIYSDIFSTLSTNMMLLMILLCMGWGKMGYSHAYDHL